MRPRHSILGNYVWLQQLELFTNTIHSITILFTIQIPNTNNLVRFPRKSSKFSQTCASYFGVKLYNGVPTKCKQFGHYL